MAKGAYYNEIDPYAAQWLRNLIAGGHIAPGDVDDRSIEDVLPADLRGYSQCHFFAGIGVWSYALRKAGWADDRSVWTGSCPCQPFSQAGKGAAFDDERHLWPSFQHLIKECHPPVVFGEQVASKDAAAWIDLVQADVEGMGYAFGCVPFPAASIGAPHIRDRNYWVAHSDCSQSGTQRGHIGKVRGLSQSERQPEHGSALPGGSGTDGGLADAERLRRGGKTESASNNWEEADRSTNQHCGYSGASVRMAHSTLQQYNGSWGLWKRGGDEHSDSRATCNLPPACTLKGYWRDADWLLCRDGKWRPVEPGTFPLAHGVTSRVGRLRAYGNAIVAPQAQAFIECAMEAIHG